MHFLQVTTLLKQKKTRIYFSVFAIYFCAAVLFFGRGYRGELVDDGLAGLVKFQNMGWAGFWSSFGFTSLYYFHDFFVLSVYMLVGKSALGWFIVMVTLHSINASLSFIFFKRLYALMSIANGRLIAFLGSLLFLLSPYQTENVLWAATLHYAIAMAIFLSSCIILLNALQINSLRVKIIIVLCFLYCVMLMTLEISLIFPFAYLILGLGVISSKKTSVNIQTFIGKLVLPMLVLIAVYFIATRIIKGHWIPHYGETHLLNNDIKTYSTNYARYLIKLLGYVHFLQYGTRNLIYGFCERWKLMLIMEILLLAGGFFMLKASKSNAEANTFIMLAFLSFILLLPSLHMFFMYLFNTQNDRLNYYFSVAFYQLITLLLVGVFSYLGILIIFIYGITGLFFLEEQADKWRFAGIIQDNCVQSFVWMLAPKVYVLNETTYFKGAYVFRNDERLLYALQLFKGYKYPERIEQIFSSCSVSDFDSTIIDIKNDSTLHVTAVTGGWLMHEAVGAVGYNTKNFSTIVDKWNPGYEVVFHNKQPGSVYVYLTPSGFSQLKNF